MRRRRVLSLDCGKRACTFRRTRDISILFFRCEQHGLIAMGPAVSEEPCRTVVFLPALHPICFYWLKYCCVGLTKHRYYVVSVALDASWSDFSHFIPIKDAAISYDHCNKSGRQACVLRPTAGAIYVALHVCFSNCGDFQDIPTAIPEFVLMEPMLLA